MRKTLLLLLLPLVACEEHHEAVDPDVVICVVDAGDQLEVALTHSCVSGSAYDRDFSCEATLDGSEVQVSSLFTFTTKGKNTTLDCGSITTRCTTDLPPDGTSTVVHRDERFEFDVADGAVVVADGDEAACSGEVF